MTGSVNDGTSRNSAPDSPTSPGQILGVLRREGPQTRQELQARVGVSRATLVERLEVLQRLRLIRETGHRESSGGRRAAMLAADEINRAALVADVGMSHAALAVVDLHGNVYATHTVRLPARHRPQQTIPRLLEIGKELLTGAGKAEQLCAVGLSVPGQIDHDRGTAVAPPPMPEWNESPLRDPFTEVLGVPVFLENDANALALGEYRATGEHGSTLVGVKVGTGIGAGVVIDGRAYRGITGCAGEIGHIRIEGNEQRCSCGRRGCVAAIASGQALLRRLRSSGARSVRDVASRIAAGDGDAVRLADEAGRFVGTVLATVVTITNPRHLRIGGEIGALPPFLDGLRESVTAQGHAVALGGLTIEPCRLGERAPLVGLASLVADETLAPAAVDAMVATLP